MFRSPRHRRIFLAVAALGLAIPVLVLAVPISSVSKYAWGENVGWIDFGTTEGMVGVPPKIGNLSGYAWGENVGWISLSCSNTATCGTVNYGVTNTGTALTGYAWGENVGWISFSCTNTSSCGTVSYGVGYDYPSGVFSGFAYGENVGWVSFNCSSTNSCGTSDYKVALAYTPTPTPAAILPPPVPTPAPTTSPTQQPTPTASPIPSATPLVTPAPTATETPQSTPIIPSPAESVPPIEPGSPGSQPPAFQPPAAPPIIWNGGGGGGGQSSNPVVRVFQNVNDVIDRASTDVADAIAPVVAPVVKVVAPVVKVVAPVVKDACGESGVQAIACSSTTVGVAASSAGVVAGVAQHEVIAVVSYFLQIVGLRRKAKNWGTIYDSSTKRPIPFGKVELVDANNRIIETRFTDRYGRYGFLTSPESLNSEQIQVRIVASKPGYSFPAPFSSSSTDFIVYDRLYYGELLTIQKAAVLNFSIPLQPKSDKKSHIWSGWGVGAFGTLGDKILAYSFYVGAIANPISYIYHPSTNNLVIMVVFLAANLFRMFVVHRPYGLTLDISTGKPLPYALVTLNDAAGKRVGFSVSDEYGRFIISGEKGVSYDIIAYTPANIVPQRTASLHLSGLFGRGWVTSKLRI